MRNSRIAGLFFPLLSVLLVLLAFIGASIPDQRTGKFSVKQLQTMTPHDSGPKEPANIYFYPETPEPGDFLIIEATPLAGDAEIDVEYSFPGAGSTLYRAGDNYYMLVGISYDTQPGVYELSVRQGDGDNGELIASKNITIGFKDFTVSYFNVPPGVTAGWTPERLAEDREKIRLARNKSEKHPLWLHRFIMPLEGRISSEYAAIRHINNNPPRRHNGLDIAAEAGTPIVAPNNGVVRLAEYLLSGGNTVIIDHGLNLSSTYMHLESIAVTSGQKVERGDLIGAVGMTGYASGPHLHWELNIGQFPVNPLQLIENDLLWIPPAYAADMLNKHADQ